ncbi:Bacillibactin transport regulator [Sphingobacterium spiritivorum]|uniref:Bacillibactin transport regulator n=1 Tax=Sphingobacterium spiritivorum TaxID=258 RepID=A0A380BME0_SPHSI|nr:helix-turn-helix domain-containing protein [Sphingobacterium spiritivorum]SUJ02609.1 Bacillibactin transport regulator [Sphingobacterium spiritivorum]
MISVFTERALLRKVKLGDSFSPQKTTIVIIEKGSISIKSNELIHHYKKGNLGMIIPNNVYKVNAFTDDVKAYFILIDRDELNNQTSFAFNKYEMQQALRSSNNNIEKVSDNAFAHILNLCEQLFYYNQEEKEITFSQQIKLSLFTSLVYILVGDFLQGKGKDINILENSRKESITMKFLQLVSINFMKEKELKFYADKLLISSKYLSNTVREITNQPPSKFITEALLNNAKILLLNSDNSIKEISNELDFSDQYAFGKFFKKHTGLSPSNFKKTNKLVDAI